MKHFTPTLPISATAKNARIFVRENMDAFWTIFLPLLPFIIGFDLLDVVVNHYLFPDNESSIPITLLFSSYFLGAFIISWHRVVIHGPDQCIPMNPFKPKKSELIFICVFFAMNFLFVFTQIFLTPLFDNPDYRATAVTITFTLIALLTIIGFKIAFYLPAKAIDASTTLGQSWKMTTGYVWKIFAGALLSSWRAFLVIMLIFTLAATASVILFKPETLKFKLVIYTWLLPLTVYFVPLMYALTVTVLSNYYQWAINNPRNVS